MTELRESMNSPKRSLASNHIKSKASIEKLNALEKIKVSDENEIDENSCLFEDIAMPTSKIPGILANRNSSKQNRSAKFCLCRVRGHDDNKNIKQSEDESMKSIDDSEDYYDKYIKEESNTQILKICGQFCQNTSAEVQGNIIFKVLKRSNKSLNSIKYNDVMKSNSGKIGEEKFLISSKWWREWCDFVNFESIFEIKESEFSISSRSSVGLENAVNLESNTFYKISENEKNVVFDSTVYIKPGKIRNESLIDPESFKKYKYKLKESLQEMYDYVVVNSLAWSYLSSWYNYDYVISKELCKNITDPNSCILNIYPEDNEVDVDIKRNPAFYCGS